MLTRLLLPVAAVGLLGGSCGGDGIVVNDDGVSSGGVKLETLEPPRGSIIGGQNILLEGEGLGGNNLVVTFGDVAAPDVVVLSSGALLVISPPGLSPGPVDVVVANSQGFAQRNGGFTYNDPPSITTVTPDRGPRLGGDAVTITGTGFQQFDAGTNTVTFDGEPGAAVTVVSDTELTVTTPPGVPLVAADVRVANVNGAAQADNAYLYEANGLFATTPDPRACKGSSGHGEFNAGLFFIDLDDATVIDLGFDDRFGFTKIASDGEGGLVGLQTCTEDLYEIDVTTGEISLLAVTSREPTNRRHMGGLARAGNDYIVRPPDSTQFARLSLATGDVTLMGAPGGNPQVSTVGRGGLFLDGQQLFWAGSVTTAAGTGNGIAEIDTTTGAQIGQGVAVPITMNSATLHRGELFVLQRVNLGDGGGTDRAARIARVDRLTGEVDFVAFVPVYISGIVSGDL